MKTNINNRAQFISYRSQLVTKAFGRYAMIAFTALGIVALTQSYNTGVLRFEDQPAISKVELNGGKDTGVQMLSDPIDMFK